MLHLIQVFFVGMLISFLGQLPLGNMNLTATQLNVQEGVKSAWKYGLGITVVEVIYLRIALTSMNWVMTHQLLFTILGWLTAAVFLVLGVASFIAARKQSPEKKGLLLDSKLNRFVLGISISAINPVQIPFWFTWGIYMMREGLMRPLTWEYNLFTTGAGVGTLIGLAVYIHAGKWAIEKMHANNKGVNKFMGIVFIAVGLLQLYKMIFSPWTGKS